MWETRLRIVDWVYFKTQIMLETLKTLSQLRENLVYLRKSNICSHKLDVPEGKRQCLTVPQNRKLFLWMLVCELKDSLLLVYEMW